jgi:hypothetical protein
MLRRFDAAEIWQIGVFEIELANLCFGSQTAAQQFITWAAGFGQKSPLRYLVRRLGLGRRL